MTQNIYDDPDFFAGYSELPRSVEGHDVSHNTLARAAADVLLRNGFELTALEHPPPSVGCRPPRHRRVPVMRPARVSSWRR